ncbi:MAG: hypothetical protein Q9187_003213 [Circinaria calcarea]
MTAIDTFAGGMEHQGAATDAYELVSLESRFWSNVTKCEHVSKLHVMKATSDDALITLRKEGARFDFIYIDASHVALDVLHDAVLCWRMLDVRGTMVFDDFMWKGYNEDCYNPRVAIMSFLQCAAPELQAKETESQLWVTKVPNHISATKNPDPDLYYWDKPESFRLPVMPCMLRQITSLDCVYGLGNQGGVAIEAIKEDGGVILTGFSSVEDVQRVNADAASYIDALVDDRKSRSLPRETTRCTLLFGRSATAREVWLQQPDLLKIINHFLRTVSVPFNDANAKELGTDPILSAAATLDIGPGVKAQDLHRDDFIWQQTHRVTDEKTYTLGSDVALGLLVPGVRTTAANGATLVVPGSHLWDHSRRPKLHEAEPAEMSVGEAFIFLGSTVHAGGANTTLESRAVHGFFYCRSYLRPEENQFLWWTKKDIEKWSLAAQKQAGYVLDNPFLGHCNETNPVDLFRVSDVIIT